MDSCFFENISKLFDYTRLKKQCVILTDGDKDYSSDGKYTKREILATERIARLNNQHETNNYVEIINNDNTFEIEVFKDNISYLCDFIEENFIYTRDLKAVKLELTGDNIEQQYDRIIIIANKQGKGWLTLDFITWLDNKSEEYKKGFTIPNYILNSLKIFFNKNNYGNIIIKDLINGYCTINNVEIEKLLSGEEIVKDIFINYLLEQIHE